MLYHAYELTHAAVTPMRMAARMGQQMLQNPLNPLASLYGARLTSASLDMFINATRRYAKPSFDLPEAEETVLSRPFCNLVHFKQKSSKKRQKVLIVAPMSGHYATLLRGTVVEMLKDHDVYITDWVDARDVPSSQGGFDLDDYVDYLVDFCQHLGADGERPAVMAVCQPGVPMMVAATLMAQDNNPCRPASITLMGAPIDTAINPQTPNDLAMENPLSWFENNVIVSVPWPNAGFTRRVYPGFLQLSGFMSMNMDKHVSAHKDHFQHLVVGDGDNAEQHRAFYDEYMAVMDLTAEYYLQTIERVFQKRLLAIGQYEYRGKVIDTTAIKDIALMTVEGEKDDITGLGQTKAAHDLISVPDSMRQHFLQKGVGHYGVFNGSRWRSSIQPKIAAFIKEMRAPVKP